MAYWGHKSPLDQCGWFCRPEPPFPKTSYDVRSPNPVLQRSTMHNILKQDLYDLSKRDLYLRGRSIIIVSRSILLLWRLRSNPQHRIDFEGATLDEKIIDMTNDDLPQHTWPRPPFSLEGQLHLPLSFSTQFGTSLQSAFANSDMRGFKCNFLEKISFTTQFWWFCRPRLRTLFRYQSASSN